MPTRPSEPPVPPNSNVAWLKFENQVDSAAISPSISKLSIPFVSVVAHLKGNVSRTKYFVSHMDYFTCNYSPQAMLPASKH